MILGTLIAAALNGRGVVRACGGTIKVGQNV